MNNLDFFNKIKLGVSEIITENELINLFDSKKNIQIKVGFDPTSDSLHLGHFLVLNKLKQFQEFGYSVNFLIGDFTAMIGDPTGKNKTRKCLTKDEIFYNYKSYSDQVFKILNPQLTKIFFNSSWFSLFSSTAFLKLASMFTVSHMLERSDFKLRYSSNLSIGIHEFLYPLLQAYDSVFLKSDLEVGGIDQKFNFLLTRDMQKRNNQKSQVVIMMPLLKGLDGVNKMSKSLGNHIGISDSPFDMFSKIMSISDVLMKDYYNVFGFLNYVDFDNCILLGESFMDMKLKLAYNIVLLFYSKFDALLAKQRFIDKFCNDEFLDFISNVYLFFGESKVNILDVLVRAGFVLSYSEAKRMLKCNSVKIDGFVVNRSCFLDVIDSVIIQVGKKRNRIILKKI